MTCHKPAFFYFPVFRSNFPAPGILPPGSGDEFGILKDIYRFRRFSLQISAL
jgi:hypothetical protein